MTLTPGWKVIAAAAVWMLVALMLVALMLLAGCGSSGAVGSGSTSADSLTAAASAPGSEAGSDRAAGCGHPLGLPVDATATQTLSSGGRDRTYLIHLPAGYRPNRPNAVILAFHGRKGTGNDIEAFSGIDALDAIAVYPRGLPAGGDNETAWQGAPGAEHADDVRFVGDLLDRLRATLCVDPNRVFATGKSEGGGFAALLSCRLRGGIAAFATVSAAFYPGTDTGCAASLPVSIVDFHGTGDTIMKYDGGVSHQQHYPSIPDTLRSFATRDHCAGSTSAAIGSDVTELSWHGCAPGAALEHYRITDGGHTWPGALADSGPGKVTHTISATQLMWAFFQSHPKH